MTVPAEIVALREGAPVVGAREQAFPFVTVDADVRAAVRSRRTRENLERRGRAALIAVEGRTAHYVKLRLVRSTVVHDLLACVFEVAEHKPDSMGIALPPIS